MGHSLRKQELTGPVSESCRLLDFTVVDAPGANWVILRFPHFIAIMGVGHLRALPVPGSRLWHKPPLGPVPPGTSLISGKQLVTPEDNP